MAAMLFDAIQFATRAHNNQFRKGTRVPYVFHVCAVAKTLIEYGCADEVIVAALLHDTVEDTPITDGEIRTRFGDQVADWVSALTEPDRSQQSWEERKQHTLDVLPNAPREVLLINCADKLDNIRSIRQELETEGETLWSRFNRGREKQRWFYQALVNVLEPRMRDPVSASLVGEFKTEVELVFGE